MLSDAHELYCIFDQRPGEFADVFSIFFELRGANCEIGLVAFIA